LRQRKALFTEVSSVETDLQQIAEDRESELEEAAQEERTARLLDRLDVRGKAELEEIDRALQRIRLARYGSCETCHEPIPQERLVALPSTPYCLACAERLEHGEVAELEAGEVPRSALLPPDYSLLSGRELEDAIGEHLRDDGRVDMEELRIVCRNGVAYLGGAVPSEAEHRIVLQTLTDLMGLPEVVDRLRIKEILWQREDRSKEEPPSETKAWEETHGTEDVTALDEHGADYVPPTRPVPDEE
jgi:DnaK suppressor protein